jgi:hypothetical protein
VPDVPKPLRVPCELKAEEGEGAKAALRAVTGLAETNDCNADRLVSIDAILTKAEEDAEAFNAKLKGPI